MINIELEELDEFYELVNNGPPTLQQTIHKILGNKSGKLDPILLPMVKRLLPQILAASIVGVQPMTSAAGGVLMAKANPLPKRLRYD